MDGKLYVITGCTAVGKTDYAINFAMKNNAEIVSCDSLLVYKHMDIGTAKPKPADMRGIEHHCMDLVEPSEKFDVSMFIEAAQTAISSIVSSGKNVVVVGGSGFYLKSFYRPVIDETKIPQNVNDLINSIYAKSGLDGLVPMLISINDGMCPPIDMKNPRRVMSALKRCLAYGKTFDSVQNNFISLDSPFKRYQKYTILLERDQEDLKLRIWERTKKMLHMGLIHEVKFLLSKYGRLSDSAKNAIGYRETINWLKSNTTEDALVNEISQNTLKLVKKQKTWFKKQIPIDVKIILR
ncbi:MAG: tRNA (adenosine(37)-N6)-dimethylallyltransferase MiaA [Puniceicoccales bacterium]|jgi:tRNA dimethylallyltransferase|nr:tRNA (adenosine(37)-N6)-dimethylallyltransferase MiaA [Puniceicoccales bacterium]